MLAKPFREFTDQLATLLLSEPDERSEVIAPRLMSAAYYATFHCFSERATVLTVAHSDAHTRARRSIAHRDLYRVSKQIVDGVKVDQSEQRKVDRWLKQSPVGMSELPHERLGKICTVLKRSYADRISADYAGDRRFGKTDALLAHKAATDTSELMEDLTAEDDSQFAQFSAAVLWPKEPESLER